MILAAITTCRRKPEMLERAVKSVVNQTYTDWNLVIIDDSPADYEFRNDVKELAESYSRNDSRIKYIQLDKNYGANHARNVALKIAANTQGGGGYDFIAYLDDDDEWLPEKLEKQIAKFSECDEKTALIYCNEYIINCKTNTVREHRHTGTEGYAYDKLMSGKKFIGTTSLSLIRTKSLAEIGGFDENMPCCQEYEMYLRLAKLYKVAYVDDFLVNYYAEHGEQIGGNPKNLFRAYEIIINKNQEYLINHKNTYRLMLRHVLFVYYQWGQRKDFYNALLKYLSLQPAKIFSNVWMIIVSFVMFPLALFIRNNIPGLFAILRGIKNTLKGRN